MKQWDKPEAKEMEIVSLTMGVDNGLGNSYTNNGNQYGQNK